MNHIIKKSSSVPTSYYHELCTNNYDEASLSNGAHSTIKSRDIFNKIKALPSFNSFKAFLLKEQGYLCCYCNCKISTRKDAIVEHLKPLSKNRSLIGEYSNLLLSCEGGNKIPSGLTRPTYPLHCDKAKDNDVIPITPLDAICLNVFSYTLNGNILGLTVDSQTTIQILQLDCTTLINKRKAAIECLIYDTSGNILTEDELERLWMSLWDKDSNGQYQPFFYIIQKVIYDYLF